MAVTLRTASSSSAAAASAYVLTVTPAVNDLWVVYCTVSGNTNATPTCTDDNGGTYTPVDAVLFFASSDIMSVFIRDQPLPNTTSTTITVSTGVATHGIVGVAMLQGAQIFGIAAIRSKGSNANQTVSPPTATLNQNALTTNLTLIAAGLSGAAGYTAPGGWSGCFGNSAVLVDCQSSVRANGFTGTLITYGTTGASSWATHAIEIDGSTVAPTAWPAQEAIYPSITRRLAFATNQQQVFAPPPILESVVVARRRHEVFAPETTRRLAFATHRQMAFAEPRQSFLENDFPIAFAAVGALGSDATSSSPFSVPNNSPHAGDALILFVCAERSGFTPLITTPAGWLLIGTSATINIGGGKGTVFVYYRLATGAEGIAGVSIAGTWANASGRIASYRNGTGLWAVSAVFDGTCAQAAGTTPTIAAGGDPGLAAGDMLVSGGQSLGAVSAPSWSAEVLSASGVTIAPTTERADSIGASTLQLGIFDGAVTVGASTGAPSMSFTLSQASDCQLVFLRLRSMAAPPAGYPAQEAIFPSITRTPRGLPTQHQWSLNPIDPLPNPRKVPANDALAPSRLPPPLFRVADQMTTPVIPVLSDRNVVAHDAVFPSTTRSQMFRTNAQVTQSRPVTLERTAPVEAGIAPERLAPRTFQPGDQQAQARPTISDRNVVHVQAIYPDVLRRIYRAPADCWILPRTIAITATAVLVLTKPILAAIGAVSMSGVAHLVPVIDLISASGWASITGTATLVEPKPVIASTGLERFLGVGSFVEPRDVIAAAGVEKMIGTGALIEKESIASTGLERFLGSGTLVEPRDVIAATGKEITTGTATLQEPTDVIGAAGAERMLGVATAALPRVVLACAGAEKFSGTCSIHESVVCSGIGWTSIVGSAVLVPARCSVAAAGTSLGRATGTGALVEAIVLASSGAERLFGIGALVPSRARIASTAAEKMFGAAAFGEPSPSFASTGRGIFSGVGGLVLPSPKTTEAGLMKIGVLAVGSLVYPGDRFAGIAHRFEDIAWPPKPVRSRLVVAASVLFSKELPGARAFASEERVVARAGRGVERKIGKR